MSKEQRQEQEREAMRNLILATAGELVAEKGIEKLSIRKIAERMGYSAGIIYHYFQGKEDIVEQLLQQGYQELMGGLTAGLDMALSEESAEIRFSRSLSQFIRLTTAEGSQYRNVMLNDSPSVLSHTAVLHKGAALERNAISMLCSSLRHFSGMAACHEEEIELTAQIIWSAAFGLIVRLTVEKNLPEEQKEALITRHIAAMLLIAGSRAKGGTADGG
ncbi:TetR/AcrR family transcriptional regulator [Paenibacillus tritici]|uniref:TetR/AcrR family transcriptional regulator n=1 Tax=Paenibacillus tritici TaxID=1873425 RepID=A0ABX2DZ80_9BACL|nr:TetR/AcrR family transcriptional regulator [Paenibacillus tritici]NQX48869.1 TetR/AcrR family transcriptional regulator [Paenibacillus tritici]